MTDELDNYRDLVSGTLDIYVSIVNNDLSRIMKRLTGVTVILAGIGAVAGIFGMSEAGTAFAGAEAGGFWLVTLGRRRARGRRRGVPPPDRLDLSGVGRGSAADDRVRLRVGVGVVGDRVDEERLGDDLELRVRGVRAGRGLEPERLALHRERAVEEVAVGLHARAGPA